MKKIDKSIYDESKFEGIEKSMMEAAYHALTYTLSDSDENEPSERALLNKCRQIIKDADDAIVEERKTEEQ